MRKFILLTLALLFIVVPQLNAEKNPFMATGISLIFPGGGFTYLEDGNEYKYDTQALTYFVLEIGLLNWAAYESTVHAGEDNISTIPLALFVCVKAVEMLDVYSKTKAHNKKVSYGLRPTIDFGNDKVNVGLVCKF